jgi:hypothetical protein
MYLQNLFSSLGSKFFLKFGFGRFWRRIDFNESISIWARFFLANFWGKKLKLKSKMAAEAKKELVIDMSDKSDMKTDAVAQVIVGNLKSRLGENRSRNLES